MVIVGVGGVSQRGYWVVRLIVVTMVGWGGGGEDGGPWWLFVMGGGGVVWSGAGCCPRPQSMPRRGYFSVVFFLLFFPEDGV